MLVAQNRANPQAPPPQRNSKSLRVFRAFMSRNAQNKLVVDRVISKECYFAWLALKEQEPSNCQAKSYYRVLTNHVAGTDGRMPFNAEEEVALLLLFRKKLPWPCFPPQLFHLGKNYRSKGFHEKLREAIQQQPDSLPPHQVEAQPYYSTLAASDVDTILSQLSPEDGSYLTRVSGHLVGNYSAGFTYEDQNCAYSILRYAILGRTGRCKHVTPPHAAQHLCELHSQRYIGKPVVIYDITASAYDQCTVFQNQVSRDMLGDLVGKPHFTIVPRSDLFRLFLVMSAAYHRPGITFKISSKEFVSVHENHGKETNVLDVSYLVDPESFLLVAYAC